MPGRRFNCHCGKKRYRDEQSALAAAAADQQAYGGTVTTYRCLGGLAWHLTSQGFTPEALPSVGRRLAFELAEHGEVDLDDFRARTLRPDSGRSDPDRPDPDRPDSRRGTRVLRCAEQLTELGLVRRAPGRLVATDLVGLRRVVQVGLDAYAEERAAPRTDPETDPEPGP